VVKRILRELNSWQTDSKKGFETWRGLRPQPMVGSELRKTSDRKIKDRKMNRGCTEVFSSVVLPRHPWVRTRPSIFPKPAEFFSEIRSSFRLRSRGAEKRQDRSVLTIDLSWSLEDFQLAARRCEVWCAVRQKNRGQKNREQERVSAQMFKLQKTNGIL